MALSSLLGSAGELAGGAAGGLTGAVGGLAGGAGVSAPLTYTGLQSEYGDFAYPQAQILFNQTPLDTASADLRVRRCHSSSVALARSGSAPPGSGTAAPTPDRPRRRRPRGCRSRLRRLPAVRRTARRQPCPEDPRHGPRARGARPDPVR